MEAKQILEAVRTTYGGCLTYEDHGSYWSSTKGRDDDSTYAFLTKYIRPNHLLFTFKGEGPVQCHVLFAESKTLTNKVWISKKDNTIQKVFEKSTLDDAARKLLIWGRRIRFMAGETTDVPEDIGDSNTFSSVWEFDKIEFDNGISIDDLSAKELR